MELRIMFLREAAAYKLGHTTHSVSREIVNGSPYGLPTDLWSLGSLMVTCLSGVPAFDVRASHVSSLRRVAHWRNMQAPETEQIYTNIVRGAYLLPDNSSYEVRDLISGLLQTVRT